MISKDSRNELRKKRHQRIRKSVEGSSDRPRLVIYKSLRHIYAQVIDDSVGKTISAANSLQADVKAQIKDDMSELDIAKLVGKAVGEKAVKSGLEKVVLDRAGYKYHGRVAALADGAREAGLKF